jgi:hypothetical protein
LFACQCGEHKAIRLGNVTQGIVTNCADRTMHPHPRVKDEVTNHTAHQRMSKALGPAATKPCAVCGVVGKGNQHAYRHGDPDQRADESGKEAGQMYSLDPKHYWVLCKSHHARYDAGHRRFTPKGMLSGLHVALQLLADGDDDREEVNE